MSQSDRLDILLERASFLLHGGKGDWRKNAYIHASSRQRASIRKYCRRHKKSVIMATEIINEGNIEIKLTKKDTREIAMSKYWTRDPDGYCTDDIKRIIGISVNDTIEDEEATLEYYKETNPIEARRIIENYEELIIKIAKTARFSFLQRKYAGLKKELKSLGARTNNYYALEKLYSLEGDVAEFLLLKNPYEYEEEPNNAYIDKQIDCYLCLCEIAGKMLSPLRCDAKNLRSGSISSRVPRDIGVFCRVRYSQRILQTSRQKRTHHIAPCSGSSGDDSGGPGSSDPDSDPPAAPAHGACWRVPPCESVDPRFSQSARFFFAPGPWWPGAQMAVCPSLRESSGALLAYALQEVGTR
jgi:hypothetical protein